MQAVHAIARYVEAAKCSMPAAPTEIMLCWTVPVPISAADDLPAPQGSIGQHRVNKRGSSQTSAPKLPASHGAGKTSHHKVCAHISMPRAATATALTTCNVAQPPPAKYWRLPPPCTLSSLHGIVPFIRPLLLTLAAIKHVPGRPSCNTPPAARQLLSSRHCQARSPRPAHRCW